MKQFGNNTIHRLHYCPECNKQRLSLPVGEVPSKLQREFDLPSGEKITLYEQVCSHCIRKYWFRYFKPKDSDIRKVVKALEEQHSLPEDTSLEELL